MKLEKGSSPLFYRSIFKLKTVDYTSAIWKFFFKEQNCYRGCTPDYDVDKFLWEYFFFIYI